MRNRTGRHAIGIALALAAAVLLARAPAPVTLELGAGADGFHVAARLGFASVRVLFDSGQDRPKPDSRIGGVTITAPFVQAARRLARGLLE